MRSVALLVLALTACTSRAQAPAHAPARLRTAPRDTAEIARDLVRGRVGALFYVDRFRYHPGASKMTRLGGWGAMLEDTALDPTGDVVRAFVTAPSSHAHDRVLVLEHVAPDHRTRRTLDEVARRSVAAGNTPPPRSVETARALPFPAVIARIEDRWCLVGAPQTGLVVAIPVERSDEVTRFVTAGGLPDPIGREAARFFAFEPGSSLENGPRAPDSIAAAQASLVLGSAGAELMLEGESSSPDQAAKDASYLTNVVEEALTLNLVVVRMQLFDPVRFHADGPVVRTTVHLAPTDVDWLLGMATGPI